MRKFRRFAVCLLVVFLAFPGALAEESPEEMPASVPVLSTLSPGSRGDEVLRLQTRLAELGYDVGALDGDYGSGTRKAVRLFQKQSGLEADGIAGPLTLAALWAEDTPPAPEAPVPVDVLDRELPMLVNHTHTVDEFFVPAGLVSLKDTLDPGLVRIKYAGLQAVRTAVEALARMLEAASDEGIRKWQISAAYRSWEDQNAMLNAKISSYLKRNEGWSRSRARSAALHTVAEPGQSEHHLGLAFDINVPGASSFQGTKQCAWLHKNCWRFGFILRYPAGKEEITGYRAEAWHIRYVGVPPSLYMQEHDLVLEEYLEGIEAGQIAVPLPEVEEDILLED